MKTVERYSLLGFFLFILVLLVIYRRYFKLASELPAVSSYITEMELLSIQTLYRTEEWPIKISECTMSQCFDLSRCLAHDTFRVYVYPSDNNSMMSTVYSNILKVIRESIYYTDDPQKACLFVLSIDTVDRDRRSENYVKHVNELIENLPTEIWNHGRNHIIFNLYHGTYPDYSDHDLGFDTGYALTARASANTRAEWSLKIKDKYLVTFKGKRYVYGIGSETRDSLYHLHNGQSVVMVTTCKHNTDWKKYEDERCEEDNVEYDRWDYEIIMSNSTFCLTPRGRRLGSFRFLEALRLGCIPVVLSDDWELPFSEVIDWRQAVIIGHEDTVLTISDVLSAIPVDHILFMKQQSRGLYQRYFSSVEKIVLTSLQIIEERIRKQRGEEPRNWNRLFLPAENFHVATSSSENGYTVLLKASTKVSGRLNRIVNLLSDIHEVQKIIILWPKNRQMATNFDKFSSKVFLQPSDFDMHVDILSQTQILQTEFLGQFVLFLDERVPITSDDIRFLVDVASTEPYRLYGFYAADLKMQRGAQTIELRPSSRYSLILFHLALIK
ncbi:unnamed protein product, partial [Onchocerca ochengi]|uniref:Exostosin domain-containing protein n=1 Tax=Onchocerca ochengi TaxID=42157 RepID=A0A182EK33_ONCOC